MELTFQELKRELKQKQFKPVYLLYGEEAYFIDQITEYMEKNVLSDSEKGFNQSVVYGAETNFNELMSSLKRYPVMSNYQLRWEGSAFQKGSFILSIKKTIQQHLKNGSWINFQWVN